jgi:hypothetical protein
LLVSSICTSLTDGSDVDDLTPGKSPVVELPVDELPVDESASRKSIGDLILFVFSAKCCNPPTNR